MVGWHHRLSEYEFEQAAGVGDGQESLVCYSPGGHKELDMTASELNWPVSEFGILESEFGFLETRRS